MKQFSIAILVSATIILTGCQPLEMSGRDAVSSAKGYLEAAKSHHPECSGGGHGANCDIISRGVGAKDAVIDALNIYCSSPSYTDQGGACSPNKNAEPKLKEALKSLSQIMSDVKKVGGVQ